MATNHWSWPLILATALAGTGRAQEPVATTARTSASRLDEERRLEKTFRLLQRRELRAAIEYAEARLAAVRGSRFEWRYGDALARAYFASGDFRSAARHAQSSIERLNQPRSASANRTLPELLQLQLLTARIREAQGDLNASRQWLRKALAQASGSPRPVDRLEVTIALASLEDRAGDRPAASKLWSEANAVAEPLLRKREFRQTDFEAYRRACELAADALAAQGNVAAAAALLDQLQENLRSPVQDQDRIATLLKIASVNRQAGDYAQERSRLEEALRYQRKLATPNQVREGDILRELGDSHDRQRGLYEMRRQHAEQRQAQQQAVAHWRSALAQFDGALAKAEQLLDKSRGKPGGDVDPENVSGHVMRLLFKKAAVHQLLEEFGEAAKCNERLLSYQQARLHPADPEIWRCRARIGVLSVQHAHSQTESGLPVEELVWRTAAEHLQPAADYWSKREPRDDETYTRVIIHLADAKEGIKAGPSEVLECLEKLAEVVKSRPGQVSERLQLALHFKQGRMFAAQGHYSDALESYELACDIGKKLAPRTEKEYALARLNRAMIYKSQRQFRRALEECEEAVKVQKAAMPDPEDRRMFPYYAAIAGLRLLEAESVLGEGLHKATLDEAWKALDNAKHELGLAERIISQRQQITKLDAANLWRHFGLLHYLRSALPAPASGDPLDPVAERALARRYWNQSLGLQDRIGGPAKARTLNYLAEIEYAEWGDQSERYENQVQEYEKQLTSLREDPDFDKRRQELVEVHRQIETERSKLEQHLRTADALTAQAVAALQGFAAYPNLRYAVLCNRAAVLRALAKLTEGSQPGGAGTNQLARAAHQEAIQCLEQAIELVRLPRSMATGGDLERAEFFFHYSSAFEQLIDMYYEQKNYGYALYYAELARNRTFLDQVREVGGDIWKSLREKDFPLLVEARQKLAEHAQISDLMRKRYEADPNAKPQTDKELAELEKQLEKVREEYAQIEGQIQHAAGFGRRWKDPHLDVAAIRDSLLAEDNVVLFYYLSNFRSYLFVLGNFPEQIQAFRLAVTPELARPLGSSPGDFTVAVAKRLATAYVERIRNPASAVGLVDDEFSSQATIREGLALTDVLLPSEVRTLIDRAKPRYLLIAPDGPLYQLPFEALLVKDQDNSGPKQFLLDRFPPIAYVPSAQVLATISAPRPLDEQRERLMLMVGDVAYPEEPDDGSAARSRRLTTRYGRFVRLPNSADECQTSEAELRRLFTRAQLRYLQGDQTTEARVREFLPDARSLEDDRQKLPYVTCLLFSCHGIAETEKETANLFGSLVLARPQGDVFPNDDGFLELHEIHRLSLPACELAVLSACQTNLGPELRLETGSTLARGFMAAGARRVVSSQWKVEDKSTALLVSHFFKQVADQSEQGSQINFAIALNEARRFVRNHSDFSSPYHWAPFVLIGPAVGDKESLTGRPALPASNQSALKR